MLCYAMLCYAMLCYAMLCYAMLCYAVLCCAMLGGADDEEDELDMSRLALHEVRAGRSDARTTAQLAARSSHLVDMLRMLGGKRCRNCELTSKYEICEERFCEPCWWWARIPLHVMYSNCAARIAEKNQRAGPG
jgi:hypothetical protein